MAIQHDSDDWLGLTDGPLPIEDAMAWVGRSDCGAQVVFTGTVRDHSLGRPAVTWLHYEAYESAAMARLQEISRQCRLRWPVLGRLVMLHRTGTLAVGDAAVLVAAASPHRDEAFAVARWAVDTIKQTVPLWKTETWAGGTDWGTCAHDIAEVPDIAEGTDIADVSDIADAAGRRSLSEAR